MKSKVCLAVTSVFLLFTLFASNARAEHHRATHLGYPATRFAPPLNSPEDLRARFADPQLRPDFAEILRQSGWPGNLDDIMDAGLTNPIVEWKIMVGETMPFMSSREAGRPVCLRNVTWAGPEPIQAYAFTFQSNGRIYRCITPRPCSNFFVTDLGPAPRAGLAIDCDVMEKVIVGRPIEICLNLHNTGNIPEPLATVVFPVPDNTIVTATSDGGRDAGNSVIWQVADLPANTTKQICARLKTLKPGSLNFNASASSASVAAVPTACTTEVIGIPAILLEKADDPDPVSVGDTTTYTVKVTNQGTADDSNVQVVVDIARQLVPVSSAEGEIQGQTVTLPVIPRLGPKEFVTYKIVAKGVTAGDGHTKFTLGSDMLKSPITAEESTTVY